jgi:hypothetical protein
VRDGLDS